MSAPDRGPCPGPRGHLSRRKRGFEARGAPGGGSGRPRHWGRGFRPTRDPAPGEGSRAGLAAFLAWRQLLLRGQLTFLHAGSALGCGV